MNFTGGAYPDAPGELGGGSVGLAPFHQHMEGSAPPRGGVITDSSSNTVRMRFYGPITFDPQSPTAPVTIERRLTGSADPWNMLDPLAFTITVDSTDPLGVTLAISEDASDGFEGGFTYRIRPTGELHSAEVANEPDVVDPGEADAYTFDVEAASPPFECEVPNQNDPDCPDECPTCLECLIVCEEEGFAISSGPDFNMNGVVDDFDLKMMVQAMDMNAQGGKADLNSDGVVDATDMELLILQYGKSVK